MGKVFHMKKIFADGGMKVCFLNDIRWIAIYQDALEVDGID